jgi:hypothetical protein
MSHRLGEFYSHHRLPVYVGTDFSHLKVLKSRRSTEKAQIPYF